MDLNSFAAEVGDRGPVTVAGLGTRGGAVDGVRTVRAPSGIEWIQADEMTACCGAGTPVDEFSAALAAVGQRTVVPAGGTLGGAFAVGRSGIRRLGDGSMRDALLQARYVNAAGEVVKAGGPTVKNVSGFDVCRLLVGSHGTLGFIGEVIVRTRPLPQHAQWFCAEVKDAAAVFAGLYRPTSVLWDGVRVWALLEGHRADIAEQAERLGLVEVDGPPPLPGQRSLLAPLEATAVCASMTPGSYVIELGVGVIHAAPGMVGLAAPDPVVARVSQRIKHEYDPEGRLNPGRVR
jgi:FAD/FMN-containing dehydrogenase